MITRGKPAVPERLKKIVAERASQLIKRKFSSAIGINAESAEKHGFNYIIGLNTEWRDRFFYFCAKYRNPRVDATEEYFIVRSTRMKYLGGDRFALGYMRHTGKWCEVYPVLSLDECLDTIEREELFWPV